MRYTREHLQECFGRRLMSSVRLHLEEARVTAPEVRQDGGLITALVEFPGMGPCRVYIRIGGDAEEIPEIAGECSCCRRGDCVHVAMVLLRALRDEEGWRGEAPGTGGRERPSQGADRDRHPDATSHQILYLLRPERPLGDMLEVSVITARRLPNGGYDGVRDYRPAWASRGRPPRFLQHGDIALLGALSRLPSDPAGRIRLRGAIGEQLLPDMLETGRCCLHQPEKALRTGATRKGTLAWWIDRQGVQFPRFGSLPPAGRILRLQSLWYIDIERGECGRLESGLPAELVNRLLELTGGLMPEAVQAFNRMVCERFPDVVPPLPRSLSVVSREGVVPTPCLYFTRHGREGSAQDGSRDLALLSFDYGGLVFESGHVSRYFDGERVWQVARDTEREAACVERLRALGLKPVPREWGLDDGQWGFYLPTGSYGWADLQLTSLPRLQASGWRIGFDPGFGHRLATVEAWQGQLDPLEKQDWFGVSLGVRVDGEYINLLPALVNLLRDGAQGIHVADEDSRPLLVPLGDGRKVAVPRFRLQHILDTLLELTQGDPLDEAGRLPMRRSQLARVAELAGEGDRAPIAWEGAEVLQTLAGRLRRIDRLEPVAPPAGLQARLRDYQALGVAWLQFLRACRLGGVLADDMGLGKTLQALAHLLLEQEQGRMDRPSLVLAPTSLMTNWRREAARFAPGLRVLLLHGPGRHARFREIPRHDLVITSYPLLVRDREQLCQQGYHLLILDEAQTIKNPKTRVSRAVRELDARHRLCLTGTPMENHLG
ncbi:MAG TPA: DEAD/DEAH box helicase, partial [Sedimenticola sp.]|nr:DEAD/DEAH box helicase [Sedimenticola sp.]